MPINKHGEITNVSSIINRGMLRKIVLSIRNDS